MPSYIAKSSTNETVEFPALDLDHAEQLARQRGVSHVVEATESSPVTVVSRACDLVELVRECRRRRLRSGLVPTMGALHAGHISLVDASIAACDYTITTIFVNPTQFAPEEDLEKYPRTLDADLESLAAAGAHACFVPAVDEMYPPGSTTMVAPPKVASRWEGEFRPTHFSGVATVVLKLFHVAPVDDAFFGQKDYQQALVIRHMVRDLKVSIRIHTEPIVREQDGLALSSRNRYLSEQERETALAVPQCLQAAERLWRDGQKDAAALRGTMTEVLQAGGIERIDYAAIADAETLEPLDFVDRPAVALVAAHVGGTRLIDNRVLDCR